MPVDYDLVVRGGTVVDGSGAPRFVGDVAVKDGWIMAVGKVPGKGAKEIEATGKLVTPGFVDIHTHYDGQVVWSDRLAPSSDHGVTTVMTGNCGIGFAPCRPDDHDALVSLMEGVEDIPEAVAVAGLTWDWETFPEYLDAVERRPRDIDVVALVPHSPLRAYVMGERGMNREKATLEDLAHMRRTMREALDAGAIGIGTSRVFVHRTSKGEFIPSFDAAEEELLALADTLREAGRGVFQMVSNAGFQDADQEFAMMERVAQAADRPFTYTQAQGKGTSAAILAKLKSANDRGIHIKAQMFPRPIGLIVGLRTSVHPFSMSPSYAPLKALPLAEKVARMRDPAFRARLIDEMPGNPNNPVFLLSRNFNQIFSIGGDSINYEPRFEESVSQLAARAGRRVEEAVYDMLLDNEGKALLLVAMANYSDFNLDWAETALRDPNVVIGLGDGGAHYGMICDASYPTFALAHWTRDRAKGRFTVEEMVKILARVPAEIIDLRDRGLIATGHRADLNVIDYEHLKLHPPELVHDLPGGGLRIHQRADGFTATIVNGVVIAQNGTATDARPGRLVRGRQMPRAAAA